MEERRKKEKHTNKMDTKKTKQLKKHTNHTDSYIKDEIPNQILTGNWTGFAFINGKLVTPERRTIEEWQLRWISLTCTLAKEWQKMMEETRAAAPQGGLAASDPQRITNAPQKTVLRKRRYPATGTASIIVLRQVLIQRQQKRKASP
ncbi:hypothetical protein LZ757_06390 [Xylella fastidiosa subsp. morus]|uniref:hypothetical protein n=1 Tax=Xylella fastidiosa TaxID=2371 RepID=UPI0004B346DF|nr:hypothetical protein [Xylella fastidiosa]UIN27773.1 hypothetical protein IUD23_10895 [Xylella fastidiosa subsp. morus]UIT35714.1 hypothetical protein LZ757_06390 [Xylella fastidiosa subsp. morus]UIT38005.1 hypothetical protein LZ755_06400 [Xylella fastidiosa subsp. morus]UIT44483.1 hypothetical protein LZ758_06040 [Xylella fastidiosa subsp. morus]